jgi:nicotinamidase-related amidase
VREAFNLGYYVVVPRDCVASNNAALHEATLQNVEFLIGDVSSSVDLIEYWSGHEPAAIPPK